MKKLLLIVCFYFIISNNIDAQFAPDIPIEIEFFHPSGYKDSIVIGVSLNADEGYDKGLDVIDTSAMNFPLDVRIYDPIVEQQIGGPSNYNLKHSYLSLPSVTRGSQMRISKKFFVLVKSDDINFNIGPNYQNDCNSLSNGLGSTYFVADSKLLENYQFYNGEGWNSSGLGVNSNDVNFHANFDIFDTIADDGECISINNYGYIQYALLEFHFAILNSLFLSVDENYNTINIQIDNGHLLIDNSFSVYGIYIFDLNGRMLYSDFNKYSNTYNQILPIISKMQPYLLTLTGINNNFLLTHKFFIP